MRAKGPRAVEGRQWRELEATAGLVLMWAGFVALSLQVSLLEGWLNVGGLLFRTVVILVIWCLSLHAIRERERKSRLQALSRLPAGALASWVARQLAEMGYGQVTYTRGNRGVDFIAEGPAEVAVARCRQYGPRPVDVPTLRDLYITMRDLQADRAFLATTGRLTRGAQRWAVGKPLTVWDGEQLAALTSETGLSPDPAAGGEGGEERAPRMASARASSALTDRNVPGTDSLGAPVRSWQ